MSKWITYVGEYDKTWYDVKTVYGKIYKHCWPNAMDFHADGIMIPCAEVSEIRKSPTPLTPTKRKD